MRGIIKGVLSEELGNSLRMKKEYEKALKMMPKGCLWLKKIKGREYYYIVYRVDRKLKFIYRGKISAEEKRKYEEVKMLRAKYRKLLSQAKKQIKFLRSSLRGKEAI